MGLGLAEVGVELDDRGRVTVDDSFQTNLSGMRAIGDVIHGPMLAHKAEEDGVACAEIIAGQSTHVNYGYGSLESFMWTQKSPMWDCLKRRQPKKE